MSKSRTKLPVATPEVAGAIKRLATLRTRSARIRLEAKPLVDMIVKHGSCQAGRRAAYVSRNSGGMVTYFRSASTAVRITKVGRKA